MDEYDIPMTDDLQEEIWARKWALSTVVKSHGTNRQHGNTAIKAFAKQSPTGFAMISLTQRRTSEHLSTGLQIFYRTWVQAWRRNRRMQKRLQQNDGLGERLYPNLVSEITF